MQIPWYTVAGKDFETFQIGVGQDVRAYMGCPLIRLTLRADRNVFVGRSIVAGDIQIKEAYTDALDVSGWQQAVPGVSVTSIIEKTLRNAFWEVQRTHPIEGVHFKGYILENGTLAVGCCVNPREGDVGLPLWDGATWNSYHLPREVDVFAGFVGKWQPAGRFKYATVPTATLDEFLEAVQGYIREFGQPGVIYHGYDVTKNEFQLILADQTFCLSLLQIPIGFSDMVFEAVSG